MGAKKLSGTLAAAVPLMLLLASSPQAGSPGHVEPLDGAQSATSSLSEPRIPAPLSPPMAVVPQGDLSPRVTSPSGGPLPPNQLTPAPVLPFNPNRSLMPSPSAPASSSGSGRFGR